MKRRRNSDRRIRSLELAARSSRSPKDAVVLLAEQVRTGMFDPATIPLLNDLLAPAMAATSRVWFEQAFSPYPREETDLWSDDAIERSWRGSRQSFNQGPVQYFDLALRRSAVPVYPNFYGTATPDVLGLMTPTDQGVRFSGEIRLNARGEPEFAAYANILGFARPRGMPISSERRWGDDVFGIGHLALDSHVTDRLERRRPGAYLFRSREVAVLGQAFNDRFFVNLVELRLEIAHPLLRGDAWVHDEIASMIDARRNPPPRLVGARWEDKRYGTPRPLVFTREVWGADPDDENVEQFTERWVVAPHGSRFKVEGGRIWPLYHATSYVKEILGEGFRLDKKGGLGGMSTGKAISFTQSLPFACVIANSLVDAIRLAAGRVIPGDVLDRAEREGGGELVEKTIWWYDIDRGGRGGPRLTNLDALEGDARTDATWRLYNAYLRARSELKINYDPGFFGVTWRAFVGLDESNVGVLECEAIDPVWLESSPMEHVPGAFTYHGWNRPPFAPDQDEYRLYDVSAIRVIDVVEKDRYGGCPKT